MALNTEYNVANLPQLDISRSRFDKSHSHKTTLNCADLVPIFIDEMLPGSTCTIHTNKLVRLQTLLYPIMDNLYLDTYFFAIPLRLLWNHLPEFFGENTSGHWYPNVSYQIPTISTGSKAVVDDNDNLSAPFGFPVGSVADYMGVPINTYGFKVNALPFRAYAMVWNEFFRDENLSDPVYINKGDGDTDISSYLLKVLNGSRVDDDYRNDGSLGLTPLKVAKYKDLYTTMLPSPQKGPNVTVPFDMSGIVPVVGVNDTLVNPDPNSGESFPTKWVNNTEASKYLEVSAGGLTYVSSTGASGLSATTYPINLGANFDLDNNTAGGFTINQLRLSVATQRFLEVSAMYGSRLTETIQGHFGVTPADSRLQRPEFIGGSHFPLAIDQVVQMSETSNDSPMGETAAYSVTAHSDDETIVYSSQEWCLVLGLACVRYEHSYQQGLDKLWTRSNMMDFYFPEYSSIGEVGIEGKEVVYQGENFKTWKEGLSEADIAALVAAGHDELETRDDEVIGYQEAWYSYRYSKNRISGEMHSGITNTLDAWHLADYYDIYAGAPVLGDEWIREDGDIVNRVLAVSNNVANQVLLDLYFEYDLVAPLPVYSIPSLTDIRG